MARQEQRNDMVLTDGDLVLRPIEERDHAVLWHFIHGRPDPEWKKWDAPYFPLEYRDFESFCRQLQERLDADEGVPSRLVIEVSRAVIGTVSYYWEHKPSNWLEVGIVIYDPAFWNGGIGTRALRLWIDHLFKSMPSLPRIGLTTWSGNERMMRCAEKLGMKLEGRLRKCRYYNGAYYDSIRMGVLREEWEQRAIAPSAARTDTRRTGGMQVCGCPSGSLHHIEINVSDLRRSAEFWGWFLSLLGYEPYQEWHSGRSWRLGDTYLVFVQAEPRYHHPPYHRRRVGLNHLAFHAASRAQVDKITQLLRQRGVSILYEDRHPYAGGPDHYAVFFEDPDRIKVEVVAP
ncbi:Protein N-acetyltransferase, RimJ/RimL family [Alicyclobacillus macrosporangiidus]|uniref:Protein N-acetyltransferase, RimJ/RimL family n=2 Tax=Alicyclobacillus macrosporangiidus TaxID=392015 RepID=A0A1I7F112_9BACL|nr:Protein N-acetyltransferase, RimJ/RimL family [Alicyclobacillus macrosporangiidus]